MLYTRSSFSELTVKPHSREAPLVPRSPSRENKRSTVNQINSDGSICAVPEQIPQNWYRRTTPYGIANVVANAPGTLAAGNVLPSPISNIIQQGNANEIGCFLYQLLSSQSPASLTLGTSDGASALLTGLQNQLLGGLPVSQPVRIASWTETDKPAPVQTIFGCSGAKTADGTSVPAFDDSLQAQGPGGDQVLACA